MALELLFGGTFLLLDPLHQRWCPAQCSKQENLILDSPEIMPALSLCRETLGQWYITRNFKLCPKHQEDIAVRFGLIRKDMCH